MSIVGVGVGVVAVGAVCFCSGDGLDTLGGCGQFGEINGSHAKANLKIKVTPNENKNKNKQIDKQTCSQKINKNETTQK